MAGAGEKLINSIQQIRDSAAQQHTHRVPNTRLEILSADIPTTLRCEEDRVLLGFSFPVNKCMHVCVWVCACFIWGLERTSYPLELEFTGGCEL